MNIDETTEHIVNNTKQTEIKSSCGKLSIHIHFFVWGNTSNIVKIGQVTGYVGISLFE